MPTQNQRRHSRAVLDQAYLRTGNRRAAAEIDRLTMAIEIRGDGAPGIEIRSDAEPGMGIASDGKRGLLPSLLGDRPAELGVRSAPSREPVEFEMEAG